MGAEDANSLYLCGTAATDAVLDHELFDQEFYQLMLSVERLSGVCDILPVTLPGRIIEALPVAGERLHIHGQIRSYNRTSQHGGRLMLTAFARSAYPAGEDDGDFNEVAVSGYLCKQAQVRTTPFLREIADMLLAVNRPYNKSDYLPLIAWGRNAHLASELPVGSHIYVTGRLQSREYQKSLEDGQVIKRTAYEVSVGTLQLI